MNEKTAMRLLAIILVLLIVLPCIIMLAGCGPVEVTVVEEEKFEYTFTRIDTDLNSASHVLVDDQTGVMYLFVISGYGGGLSVMVDETGAPLIWEGE